jgi:hypothetical protein
MTERTVTVQTETEEAVNVCDECGLSEDHGELIEYKPGDMSLRDEYDNIHFHRACLDEMGVEVPEAQTYAEIANTAGDHDEYDLNVVYACSKFDMGLVLVGYLFLSAGLFAIQIPLVRGMAVVLGAILTVAGFQMGRAQAKTTEDEIYA